MIPHPSIAAVFLVLLNGAATAQSVYRCGATYQDSPCVGGKVVDVNDERSDEQRAAARETTRNEAELGASLQRQRLALEHDRRPTGAANIGPRAKAPARPQPPKGQIPKPKKKKIHRPSKKA